MAAINTGGRDLFLDALKGVAIILVVAGHVIQYGSGDRVLVNQEFFNYWLYKFIYSFHMPLFMLVSGFLFAGTVNRYGTPEVIRKQIFSLLVPVFVWQTLCLVVQTCGGEGVAAINLTSVTAWAKLIYRNYFLALWFLWAVFFCSLAVVVVRKFFKDCLPVYGIIFLSSFFITDNFNFYLYKFMFPFFVLAYWRGNVATSFWPELAGRKNLCFGVAIWAIFGGMLYFYRYEDYIYTSQFTLLGNPAPLRQLGHDLYRVLIGLAGSGAVIWSIKNIYVKRANWLNWAIKLGPLSLLLYIISWYANMIMPLICDKVTQINLLLVAAESIIILLFGWYANKLMAKNRYLNRWLLGGRATPKKQNVT